MQMHFQSTQLVMRPIKFSEVVIGYDKSHTRDELWSKFALLIKRFSVHNSQSPAVIHCVNLRCQHQYNLFFSLQLCSPVESKPVCVWGEAPPTPTHPPTPIPQHCLDHWPPWAADQPLYQLYQVLRRSHWGFCPKGVCFLFSLHALVATALLTRVGPRVCLYSRPDARTVPDQWENQWNRAWQQNMKVPPGGAAEKDSHPLRRECLFKPQLLLYYRWPRNTLQCIVAWPNPRFGPY